MSLPIKCRPEYLEDVVGNESAIQIIDSLLDRELADIPTAWMFTGPSGTGKTTLARIVKEELQCNDMCFYEYNASNTRGIDTVRQIQEDAVSTPLFGDIKIFLLDECHHLTGIAQNALLKPLEDSPKNTFFFLATTNPEKMIKPIHSRCVRVATNYVSSRKLVPYLRKVSSQESNGVLVDISEDILVDIAKASEGVPRDAMKLLDVIMNLDSDQNITDIIAKGVSDDNNIMDLVKLLIDKKSKWSEISKVLKQIDSDPESIRRQILGILNGMLLQQDNIHIAAVVECFMENYFDSGKAGLTYSCFSANHI